MKGHPRIDGAKSWREITCTCGFCRAALVVARRREEALASGPFRAALFPVPVSKRVSSSASRRAA